MPPSARSATRRHRRRESSSPRGSSRMRRSVHAQWFGAEMQRRRAESSLVFGRRVGNGGVIAPPPARTDKREAACRPTRSLASWHRATGGSQSDRTTSALRAVGRRGMGIRHHGDIGQYSSPA